LNGNGIWDIENLDLEDRMPDAAYESPFVFTLLRLDGAAGSPVIDPGPVTDLR
jgi:hypothetical protein